MSQVGKFPFLELCVWRVTGRKKNPHAIVCLVSHIWAIYFPPQPCTVLLKIYTDRAHGGKFPITLV